MKITQDVRDYAKEHGVADDADALAPGMADKAKEFREAGSEIYRPQ
jgi:phosphomethylpyrimidine synthase